MSEQNIPQIEDEIRELLDGDLKERALDFADYLNANQMMPQLWFGPTYWRVPHGSNYLCCIKLDKDKWRFWFFQGDYSGELDEGIKKTVCDNVNQCINCIENCRAVAAMTIFGREYTDVCCNFPVQFENPCGSTMEHIKALIEYWKTVAPRSDSWHVRDNA